MDNDNGDGDDRRALRRYWESLGTSPEMIERMFAERGREQPAAPAAVAEVLELELGEQFDAIDRFKDQTTKVRYVVVTTWTGCGVTERDVFTYRKRAVKEVVRLQKVTRHRSRSKALRDKPFHEDTAVVTVEPQVVPVEFYGANGHKRSCACGCGEDFVPANERQQFVNGAHKQRAWRRSQSVTVDPVTV